MLWLPIAILSRFFFACCNVMDSHFSRNNFQNGFTQNYVVALFYAVLSLFLLALFHPAWPMFNVWPWICTAAFFQSFYLIPYFEALKEADSSVVTSLFTLGRALTPLVAIILINERLSVWGYIGFGVVIIGAIYHSYVPGLKKFNIKPALLMALSGLMVAVFTVASKPVFNKIGIRDGFIWIVALSSFLSLLTILIPSLRAAIKTDLVQSRKTWMWFFVSLVSASIANFLFFFSLALAKASYVTMIAQFQPFFVLAIVYSLSKAHILTTRESFSARDVKQKLTGFLIMAAGLLISFLPELF